MQHSPRPAVMSLVVWSALIPICVPAVIAATGGPDHVRKPSYHRYDMTILSLLYLTFVATILGYGIWGALLGRYETLARGAVIIAGAGSRAGERRGVTRGNVDRDAALRAQYWCWTLYQYVWISCAPYCARVRG